MVGVEPAGERTESGQDELGGGRDEAAARDLAASQMTPELGVEMAGDFWRAVAAHGFVAER